ncbi:hypothetical protein [Marilutibacter spongiae]|uniref:General secretion pathway protein GspN n=1 Tax=Marilutibacter spongiae TaxID=2025720 RepID=A0A7W3TIR9_9GAMM|nr:hypothetical protein [Lysobacter spongiae]MBB1059077.1 hypothetical protein [Lysobacter spongiae]
MRLDNAGPRTWLLGAVAGWAMIAFLLAIVGMGGRVVPIEAGEDMRQPLPPVPRTTARALGPMDQYAEISTRPLFISDRKPRPFTLRNDDEGKGEDSSFDYVLTSVLITPRLKMAIIQPADGSESVRVKLDEAPESHPAWRLVELAARSAVFEGPEGRRNMELRVFDGEGGTAPTAMNPPGGTPPAGLPEPPRDPPAGQVADADGGKPEAEAKPAMTPESQMEAIRQRIQARRAALREQSENRQTPPRQPMPPDPPSSPPPNPPAESR